MKLLGLFFLSSFILASRGEVLRTCAQNPCHQHAICAMVGESYKCYCKNGFISLGSEENSKRVCENINECKLVEHNHCVKEQYGGYCTDTEGSFYCGCAAGWKGNGKITSKGGTGCSDIDECAIGTHKCYRGGTKHFDYCRNTFGSYVCFCPSGLTLSSDKKTCLAINECTEPEHKHNCSKEATCVDQTLGYNCSCNEGFEEGFETNNERCSDINECEVDSKGNIQALCDFINGTCWNTRGSYVCFCKHGYKRNREVEEHACHDRNECEESMHDCDLNDKHLRCVNTLGSFKCVCEDGFTLNTSGKNCVDINECANASEVEGYPCIYNQYVKSECKNFDGGYECTCPSGYHGDGKKNGTGCQDTNECDEGKFVCGKNEICQNKEGSYDCICNTGYERSKDDVGCIDINECEQEKNGKQKTRCISNSECHNTEGSYTCVCKTSHDVCNNNQACYT